MNYVVLFIFWSCIQSASEDLNKVQKYPAAQLGFLRIQYKNLREKPYLNAFTIVRTSIPSWMTLRRSHVTRVR